jgi:nucleoside-diphosphate-sugar epimerase
MSRVVVIGATGHIGTYLVPRLADGGHEVIAVSRGTGYAPLHTSLDALREALAWLVANGQADVGGQPLVDMCG